MAYIADLITVLKSLFDIDKQGFLEGAVWLQLNRVFQAYEQSDPREPIHRRICATLQLDQQASDPVGIGRELRELLLEREPPLSDLERNGTGGWEAQDEGAPLESSPSIEEPQTSPGGPAPLASPGVLVPLSGVPVPSAGGGAPSRGSHVQRRPRPLVWYRLFPRQPRPLGILAP